MTVVYEPSKNQKGFTGYLKEYREVISQGESVYELSLNIWNAFWVLVKNMYSTHNK